MKISNAAFWILMLLILITGIIFTISLIAPSEDNLEIVKIFASIMERILYLVGAGYFGIKMGEKERTGGQE